MFHILNNYKGFLNFDNSQVQTPATVYLTFKLRKNGNKQDMIRLKLITAQLREGSLWPCEWVWPAQVSNSDLSLLCEWVWLAQETDSD